MLGEKGKRYKMKKWEIKWMRKEGGKHEIMLGKRK